ncbi:hypothetical protein C8F01DRAFT_1320774 [Mycena amicta]|nr:hypothetical protein C8F01DRAFT_1320774 [Mycena amicta]
MPVPGQPPTDWSGATFIPGQASTDSAGQDLNDFMFSSANVNSSGPLFQLQSADNSGSIPDPRIAFPGQNQQSSVHAGYSSSSHQYQEDPFRSMYSGSPSMLTNYQPQFDPYMPYIPNPRTSYGPQLPLATDSQRHGGFSAAQGPIIGMQYFHPSGFQGGNVSMVNEQHWGRNGYPRPPNVAKLSGVRPPSSRSSSSSSSRPTFSSRSHSSHSPAPPTDVEGDLSDDGYEVESDNDSQRKRRPRAQRHSLRPADPSNLKPNTLSYYQVNAPATYIVLSEAKYIHMKYILMTDMFPIPMVAQKMAGEAIDQAKHKYGEVEQAFRTNTSAMEALVHSLAASMRGGLVRVVGPALVAHSGLYDLDTGRKDVNGQKILRTDAQQDHEEEQPATNAAYDSNLLGACIQALLYTGQTPLVTRIPGLLEGGLHIPHGIIAVAAVFIAHFLDAHASGRPRPQAKTRPLDGEKYRTLYLSIKADVDAMYNGSDGIGRMFLQYNLKQWREAGGGELIAEEDHEAPQVHTQKSSMTSAEALQEIERREKERQQVRISGAQHGPTQHGRAASSSLSTVTGIRATADARSGKHPDGTDGLEHRYGSGYGGGYGGGYDGSVQNSHSYGPNDAHPGHPAPRSNSNGIPPSSSSLSTVTGIRATADARSGKHPDGTDGLEHRYGGGYDGSVQNSHSYGPNDAHPGHPAPRSNSNGIPPYGHAPHGAKSYNAASTGTSTVADGHTPYSGGAFVSNWQSSDGAQSDAQFSTVDTQSSVAGDLSFSR